MDLSLRKLIARTWARGQRRPVAAGGQRTRGQIVDAAKAAGYPVAPATLSHLGKLVGTLGRYPKKATVLGLAAGLGEPTEVVAVCALVDTGLAPGWVAALVQEAVAAVAAGASPEDLVGCVHRLGPAHVVDEDTVVFLEPRDGEPTSDADVVDLASRLPPRRPTPGTVPGPRSTVDGRPTEDDTLGEHQLAE